MFDSSHFMPHGHCYLWRPDILWLHVISDSLIALAYFSIPIALIYFVRKRKDLRFKWIFLLFGLFIFACGLTHLASIYTIWFPQYAAEGLIKAVTALVSLVTAVLLWPMIPKVLRIPSPELFEKKNTELEDLTKNLEKKIAQAVGDSARLAAIVSHSHDAILSKTLSGEVLSWNKAAERIFGYSKEEMIGQSIFKIVPEDKLDEEKEILRRVALGLDLEPLESIRVCKDGTLLNVTTSVSPIHDARGTIVGASSILRDVTAKMLLDQKLIETTDALREKNEQLINMNKAKDEFIANLSHELRSPLNIIIGYVEFMSSYEVGSAEYKNALAVVKRNATTQLHLIEDLLDMSRIISGKFAIAVQENNLDDIMNNAFKAIEFSAHAKNIKIVKQIEGNERTLTCDPDRIQQALWNLLTNAVKFTNDGGQITFKAFRKGGEFVFEVRDTGIGISQADLPNVFARLWQSSHADSIKKGGLGLGLRIAKDIVEAHGGSISVQSEGLGKGSTFRLCLPIHAVSIDSESSKKMKSVSNPKGMSILVVGDALDALHLLKIVLERAGANVVTATNGAEALEIIRQNNIQLIVSDINMPIMDGFSFLENARLVEKEKGNHQRPAIALTARAGPGEKERAYEAGFQLHLIKPVRPEILIQNIITMVKKTSS